MKNAKIQIIIFLILTIFSLNKEIKNVKYEEDKEIGILTIKHPDNSIYFEIDIIDEIEHILDEIISNKIKVLIITEDSSINNQINYECDKTEDDYDENFFTKLEQLEIPIISVINHFSLGLMFEISLSSDIRICSEKAILGHPIFLEPQRLSRLIGIGMSKQIIFTKQIINAKEALKIGLFNEIYPQNELMNMARALVKKY